MPRRSEPRLREVAEPAAFARARRLRDYIGYNLRRAHATVFADFEAAVGEIGVTSGQFGLLTLIDAHPGITQLELSRAVGLEKSAVNPAIERLERRGFVRRSRSATDRRTLCLELTREGESALTELDAIVARHDAKVGAGLTEEERRTLLRLLRKLAASDEG